METLDLDPPLPLVPAPYAGICLVENAELKQTNPSRFDLEHEKFPRTYVQLRLRRDDGGLLFENIFLEVYLKHTFPMFSWATSSLVEENVEKLTGRRVMVIAEPREIKFPKGLRTFLIIKKMESLWEDLT